MKTSALVLGGGPAGAVASTILARAGIDVVVLDANLGPTAKIGESLPPAVRPLLVRLGLAEEFAQAGHRAAYGHRSWWGSDEAAEDDFLFGAYGAGWHLDRARFEAMLAAAATTSGARWHWDHHAVDAQWDNGTWAVDVEGPEALIRIEARFVVDATGRHARFAKGAGATQQRFDKQVGIAVVLDSPGCGEPQLDGFTTVEAEERGWWYTAPLRAGQVVVVHMTDGDLLETSSARTRAGWLKLLDRTVRTRQRLKHHVDAAPEIEPRILPAGSTRLLNPVGRGWLAVGDAAAAFDPLSSHGIGSAISSGYYGGCAVADHLHGNGEALVAYSNLVDSIFEGYLDRLGEHYALEQRWPKETFWARRHAGRCRREARP